MSPAIARIKSSRAFTLIEVLSTVAIMGVLISIAVPYMQNYTVRAQVVEGILILAELRQRVETDFRDRGELPLELPNAPAADGEVHGGPWYSYETLYGEPDDMWEQIEFQPKGPHRVIALRAYRLPQWDNSDIGLHLQIKLVDEQTLAFRCTVNEDQSRIQFIPSSCQEGAVNDWLSW